LLYVKNLMNLKAKKWKSMKKANGLPDFIGPEVVPGGGGAGRPLTRGSLFLSLRHASCWEANRLAPCSSRLFSGIGCTLVLAFSH
ncbi:hypothetical protein cypCar_00049396, partial [Cyprinus carpio]